MKTILKTILTTTVFLWCIESSAADRPVYTVGVVPQFEASKLHSIWQPILNRLEQETGFRFRLRGSPSIPEFEKEFVEGNFDFVYMNPYHLIIANELAGYVPLVRDHGRQLYGVLVVKKDSSLDTPQDLLDKQVAFPSPNALGASLQMRQELHDLFSIDVKPRYVKTHDSVYLNVLLGKTEAGGGVQKTLNQQPQEYQDALKVIHTTKKVATHPFSVSPNVPDDVKNAVRSAFLKLGQNEKDRQLLKKIPVKQIGSASMDDYLPLKKMNLERFYVNP